MEQIAIGLLVFVLRVTDVSIGTLRVLYTVRGRRVLAACLGAMEAGVFIFAISRVFKHVDSPLAMAGYALGFAAGTALGITMEKWIGSGYILARIISLEKWADLLEALRQAGFGVTKFSGEGRGGPVLMLFVVAQRRRGSRLLELIRAADPAAFVTVENVSEALGGYLPLVPGPAGVRK
jgi:uncharacterized protein YebE (UPF0316 family)